MKKYIALAMLLLSGMALAEYDESAEHDRPMEVICSIMGKLYTDQEGLMSKTRFVDRVMPFMVEAANSLPSIHYMIHNIHKTASGIYFQRCV